MELTGFDKADLLITQSKRMCSVLELALSQPTPSIEVLEENLFVINDNNETDNEMKKHFQI